jgi:AraC-like DNA-binding protein
LSLQPAQVSVASSDEWFLPKALSIMEENMANPDFDVDAFSRAELKGKLTALLELSPNEFIRIMYHRGNVGEVAFLAGFSNPNYFTKCFCDYYGVAPSEYTFSGTDAEENNFC